MRSPNAFEAALRVALLAACALLAGAAQAAAAPAYDIRNLGTIPNGGSILAWDLNGLGEVVGIARVRHQPDRGFFYGSGRLRTLPLPDGAFSAIALGVNDRGGAAGQAGFLEGPAVPVLYRRGGAALNLLDGMAQRWTHGQANDINNAGMATGYVYGAGPEMQTFVHDGTQGRAITIPGVLHHQGLAINAKGDVFIDDLDSGDFYLYSGGHVALLPQLGAAGSFTNYTGFNDRGQFVGQVYSASGDEARAFIHDAGGTSFIQGSGLWPTDINNKGWVVGNGSELGAFLHRGGVTYAINDLLPAGEAARWRELVISGINDAGQIAGYGQYDGYRRSFLATPLPVPEASTTALMLAGLGVIGRVARRRRPPARA